MNAAYDSHAFPPFAGPQERTQPSPRRLREVLSADVHGLLELDGPEQANQTWATTKCSDDDRSVEAKRFGVENPLD